MAARPTVGRGKNEMSVHFSSQTCEWATPEWLFHELDEEFGFDVDVCANEGNAKCSNYFPSEGLWSGLALEWNGTCWMNPPYGREIGKWIAKAWGASIQGATVVCLLPSRTDTSWWHDYVMKAAEIRFIRGRLKFGGALNSAPFPSAIVIFGPL